MCFDDGAVTKVGFRKKYVDGSVLLTDDIYGGAIPEGAKGNIFKYNMTYFDEEEEKFILTYSAQDIRENLFVWIYFPEDEILMHDVSVEMEKEGHKQYFNAVGRIKVIKYEAEAEAKIFLLSVQPR